MANLSVLFPQVLRALSTQTKSALRPTAPLQQATVAIGQKGNVNSSVALKHQLEPMVRRLEAMQKEIDEQKKIILEMGRMVADLNSTVLTMSRSVKGLGAVQRMSKQAKHRLTESVKELFSQAPSHKFVSTESIIGALDQVLEDFGKPEVQFVFGILRTEIHGLILSAKKAYSTVFIRVAPQKNLEENDFALLTEQLTKSLRAVPTTSDIEFSKLVVRMILKYFGFLSI